jgi:hypothetical protein
MLSMAMAGPVITLTSSARRPSRKSSRITGIGTVEDDMEKFFEADGVRG